MQAETLVETFKTHKLTLALAESCTGGLLSSWITQIPGASEIFLGSVVCYSNTSKTDLLGVPPAILNEHGAVSEPVAHHMAQGALKAFRAHYALSITGIAGPGGASSNKPLGMVCFGLSMPKQTLTQVCYFGQKDRNYIQESACRFGIQWILNSI